MALHERVPQPIGRARADAKLIEFGPAVVDRASLESVPGVGNVEFYLLTEAANRAWASISASLASGVGEVFWISGPPGAGKTHFLNYLMALEERACGTKGRRAIVRLGLDHAGGCDLEQRMFELLAREISAGDAGAMLWRRLHGAEALGVAFEQAHRVGLRGVSVFLDFGATDAVAWDDYLTELARAAARHRRITFNVYVAARTRPPAGAMALEVAPADAVERMFAAIARARRVVDDTAAAALYSGSDTGGFEPRAIFPFDPRALETLRGLAGETASVAALARLVSAALTAYRDNADGRVRPLLPVELVETAPVAKRMEEQLGEAGRAALKIARLAADGMEERKCARGIVDVLTLERLASGDRELAPGELRERLPERYQRNGSAAAVSAIAAMLESLAARTGGVITFDARSARFNPRAAGASEVAAFNSALSLLQRFDATLSETSELRATRAGIKRAGAAMARAIEAAHRVRVALETAHRELRLELALEHQRTLDDFVGLAGAGAGALVERAAEPQLRSQAEHVVAAYGALASAAAAMPRMREMREYLRATALMPDITGDIAGNDAAMDPAVASAQIECQLLLAAVDGAVPRWEPRAFDALEVRFQKFKWNYIQSYQAAHERWRRESERIAIEFADAREHFGALGRLNSIAALGASIGGALGTRIEELERRVGRCTADAPITLDLMPRCTRCGFVLGGSLPASELSEVFEEIRRALRAKLSALSRDATARLIRQHDSGHRLSGFLKIIQAAHTDALVRVLDDNLACYLGRLLDEKWGEDRLVVEPFIRSNGAAMRSGKRAARSIKPGRE